MTPERPRYSSSSDAQFDGIEVVSETPAELRVLLIEDDPDHAALTAAYLADVTEPRIDLRHADTVEAGTTLLQDARDSGRPFHVVLADQQLPDSAYWETVSRVVEAAGAAPVVALTSLGDLDIALDAVRSGASDYLIKAELSPELLRRTLRYAFERSQRDQALRQTADALRQTLQRVREMQSQLIEQERLAGFGRFVSGVAHELRNPLGLAVGAAEAAESEAEAIARLLPDLDGETAHHLQSLRDLVATASRNGRRADAVIRSMYDHARGVEGEMQPVSLRTVAQAAVTQHRADDVETTTEVEEDSTIYGTPSALTRLVANLVENATMAARAGGGHVRVTVTTLDGPRSREAVVDIADDGPGFDFNSYPDAFEPFVSYWPEARRIGLGLTLARSVATAHQGRIEVRPSDEGTTLRVAFPLPEDAETEDA